MKMMLVPLDGTRPIPLEKAIVFFGRSTDCDVILTSSRKVSRKHCCIAQIDEHYLIRDLGSMNGVRVNDEMIKDESRIKVGDEIWVGDVGFRFEPFNPAAVKPAREQPQSAQQGPKAPQSAPEPIDPAMLSQDIPIAIRDDGDGERRRPGRIAKKTPPEDASLASDSDDDVLEISEDDIVDE